VSEPPVETVSLASEKEIASFFLERSRNYMHDGGSYAIAYALLTQNNARLDRIENDIRTLFDKWRIPPELKAALEEKRP
jgi:glycyl-tRNA synthetase beta subunit